VSAYHRWYETHAEAHPEAVETRAATMPRQRRHLSAADLLRLRGGQDTESR
jgi:hypothetical protein